MMHHRLLASCVLATIIILAACSGNGNDDPAGALAGLAGQLAANNDRREVLLVYGPRELLNFDIYYRDGETWRITPPVNDKNNPREFVSTSLDSLYDSDGDGINEILVSSRLYDGNTMVKEVRWSRSGYEVLSQSTVIAEPETARPHAPQTRTASGTGSTTAVQTSPRPAPAQTEPEPAVEEKIPPIIPSWGTYAVKKGDTLYGIALVLGTSLDELERYNHNQLQDRGLRVGQRINVPVPKRPGRNVDVSIRKDYYTVRSGDTLSGISEKQGVSVRALKSWNHSIPGDGTIKVGQRLAIHHAVVTIG
ncbi:MAG: LysM peptidoglycan-binding domain-containing protein [Candidatus Glassbacteria bacterium]|nr:LysM peptidoglycan-binding domain-containing protein [Candidatus Glassbacteria bacterium]